MADRLMTDWMPMTLRPVRVGWYQVRYLIRHSATYSGPALRYWTGKRWAEDDRDRMRAVVTDEDQWRGRADPAESVVVVRERDTLLYQFTTGR